MNTVTAKEPEFNNNRPGRLEKVPTGIQGLDEITCGGLPRGRTTLVCGGPGCGKTLLALEFLVHGATQYGEPGVFVAFEETADELAANAASLGFDLAALEADQKLTIDYVRIERSEIEETGEFDLEGLFVRLGFAIDSIGAKRVAIDTLEVLFAGLPNPGILRAELRRLFRWLKAKGLTAIVTAERGETGLTRHGLEEYISDCVIALDHRVSDQISTRRLRVLKYRGSAHDTNEVPFLIDKGGLSVLPISSIGLDHQASTTRVSSGIPDLDAMLGGGGFFRGSTILVSGAAGSGKTSMAAHFVRQACREGKRCLFLGFEESSSQVIRNMRSIGIDLAPLLEHDLLRFRSSRPTASGLEMLLAQIHRLVSEFEPEVIIVDPITNLITVGSASDVRSILTRMIDFLKDRQVTTLMTSLTTSGSLPGQETSDTAISSLVDTWILVRELESNGERNRGLYILKSRGMAHSNQVREFRLTDHGIKLIDVYLGREGVLVGSAREARLIREEAEAREREFEAQKQERRMAQRRAAVRAQIDALTAELEAEEEELRRTVEREHKSESEKARDEVRMATARRVGPSPSGDNRARTIQP